jgi:methionyl-tRNA formyltransferase
MAVAASHGVPVYTPDRVSVPEVESLLAGLEVDFALAVAFGQILKPSFYQIPRLGTYNLHFSLLPRWRGASPVAAAILSADAESGITLQKINEGLDTGDLAAQASFSIEGMNAPRVFAESLAAAIPMLTDFFNDAPGCAARLVSQNHELATLCRKIHKDSGRILPSSTLLETERKLRAFDPWPGVFLHAGESRLRLAALSDLRYEIHANAGALKRVGKKELRLYLPDGHAAIARLQREGKREMAVEDFLNACPAEFTWPIE